MAANQRGFPRGTSGPGSRFDWRASASVTFNLAEAMSVAGNECVAPFHHSVQDWQSVEPGDQMEGRYAAIYLVHRIGPDVDILTVNHQPQAGVEIGIGQKREALLHLRTLARQVLELPPAVEVFRSDSHSTDRNGTRRRRQSPVPSSIASVLHGGSAAHLQHPISSLTAGSIQETSARFHLVPACAIPREFGRRCIPARGVALPRRTLQVRLAQAPCEPGASAPSFVRLLTQAGTSVPPAIWNTRRAK